MKTANDWKFKPVEALTILTIGNMYECWFGLQMYNETKNRDNASSMT